MIIRAKPRKGNDYYSVVTSVRSADKIREKTVLYIGRLDNLTEPHRIEIIKKLQELNDPPLIKKFNSILLSQDYKFPSPISSMEVEEVQSYGQELALHKLCEEIDFINTINRFTTKGGGPELGKIVEAMVINRNCDPCSYYQLQDWFSRSSLPLFLKLFPKDLTYPVSLNALNYLQPENTIPIQALLYENITQAYGYECERVDIDLTSTYFEGEECILAKFGHPRGHSKDKLQIVIGFVVDQKGILVTHHVWPGNRTDAKSLKPIDRCIKNVFGIEAPRVVDRGIATWENLKYMDRKKERYLVALRAGIKGTKLLEEIKIPRNEWVDAGENQVATSVIQGRRKYVVVWNSSVACTNKNERDGKITKAEEGLNKLLESVEKGEISSRSERDEKIGHIKRKYKVTKYLQTIGSKKGFLFTVKRTKLFEDVEKYDGYQVFVTTEFNLSEKEVVESYRTRDQIEKAIRTLKSILGLHPQNVRTEEHVLGNIFVCATAFQLRSILKMKLKDKNIDMSIEEAMGTLERLKVVQIVVGKDGEIQVQRQLTKIDTETRVLIEVFNMGNIDKLPEVEV
ncbi:MAG: IS1634 family transposase [Candidatus Thermoplasmatota archaeon]|nr:IS1634 family transposase [Candidatus Thermoplasmatota archaeon]MCG2735398.1 IS1634 family transposase [Candidatus Methanoperedenaceae archaeon]